MTSFQMFYSKPNSCFRASIRLEASALVRFSSYASGSPASSLSVLRYEAWAPVMGSSPLTHSSGSFLLGASGSSFGFSVVRLVCCLLLRAISSSCSSNVPGNNICYDKRFLSYWNHKATSNGSERSAWRRQMLRIFLTLSTMALFFPGLIKTTQGAEFGTAEEAKAMLNRVVTALKEDQKKALEDF